MKMLYPLVALLGAILATLPFAPPSAFAQVRSGVEAQNLAGRAQQAHDARDFGAAARLFSEAAQAERAPAERWRWRLHQGIALYERGILSVDNSDLHEAARVLEREALPLASREERPDAWARTQNELGAVFSVLGERGDGPDSGAVWLARAGVAFENALSVFSRESAPQEWARVQNNLGNVLQEQGRRPGPSGPDALRRAIAAYEAALAVHTRESAPADWALIQTNLGNTLQALGRRGDGAAFARAIAAFEEALRVRTRKSEPFAWAETQHNLGVALRFMGESAENQDVGGSILVRSVAAFEAALSVYSAERAPAYWANTQTSMGFALKALGERDTGPDQGRAALMRAVSAFESALVIHTRERAPDAWADAQIMLGITLTSLGERGEEAAFARATAAFEAALAHYTRERAPNEWASIQNNIGAVREAEGNRAGGRAAYESAAAYYRSALEVWTREAYPDYHAIAAGNLAQVEAKLARGRQEGR